MSIFQGVPLFIRGHRWCIFQTAMTTPDWRQGPAKYSPSIKATARRQPVFWKHEGGEGWRLYSHVKCIWYPALWLHNIRVFYVVVLFNTVYPWTPKTHGQMEALQPPNVGVKITIFNRIWYTSSNGCLSLVMLVFWGVYHFISISCHFVKKPRLIPFPDPSRRWLKSRSRKHPRRRGGTVDVGKPLVFFGGGWRRTMGSSGIFTTKQWDITIYQDWLVHLTNFTLRTVNKISSYPPGNKHVSFSGWLGRWVFLSHRWDMIVSSRVP